MAFTGQGGTAAAAAGADQVIRDGDDQDERIRRMGMSPRQQRMDRLWSYYKCDQYNVRSVAWDGSRAVGQVERDTIALAGYVPPGFYVANRDTLPVQFRRPSTPYHLSRVIVDRFTGLLFGQKRHPRISVPGDPQTEDFVNAVVEEGRLWAAFMQARTFGGGTGTAVVGFKLVQGRPQFEVFDPRWCTPRFIDRANLVVSSLEYRYTFKQEVIHPESGDWIEVDFWFRRVVDMKTDTIFEPVRVDPTGRIQPHWVPANVVTHDLGFCPVVWIQNSADLTQIDGAPDCEGVYELVEAIDRLLAQSERGILANCDPTVVISTDAQMGEVVKGSSNALKLPGSSSASYMEMTGSGVTQAREQVALYREYALEVAQCVLEQPDGQKTATEVVRSYAAMLARADSFREQYGEMGIKRLINMVIVAAASLTKPRLVDSQVTRYQITLHKSPDGKERRLGPGPYQADLTWPPYFEPDLSDATNAVTAAVGAKTGGLIDTEHAVKMIAPFFQVEDTKKLADALDGAAAKASDLAQQSVQSAGVPQPAVVPPPEDHDADPDVSAPPGAEGQQP